MREKFLMKNLLSPKSAVLRRYKSRLINGYPVKIGSVNLEVECNLIVKKLRKIGYK